MKSVGVGMIGCGGMARHVGKRLFNDRPGIELRSIYDPDKRSIEKTLKELNPNARVHKSFRALVKDPAVDWVMIASWNCFHAEQTVAAFEAGKHVFCQKPLATTLEDCVAMRKAWKKSGTMFNIGFTLRYSPHYRKIRELLGPKAIGDLISLEFNETLDFNHGGYIMGDWRRLTKYAGTHLLEKCCHDIDLANWMVGSLARRVASFGGLDFFLPSKRASHRSGSARTRTGRRRIARGAGWWRTNPFTVEQGHRRQPGGDHRVRERRAGDVPYELQRRDPGAADGICWGPRARSSANLVSGSIELKRIGFDTEVEHVALQKMDGHGGGDQMLANELADSMLNGTVPKVGLEDGLRSAVTCFAMDEAMETGKVVDAGRYWKKAGVREE